MSNYYLILTQHGSNRLAQAQANTHPFVISHLALGDANGLPYLPQSRANATALVNERVRVDVQSVAVVGTQTEVVATIESTIGGFNLHEIALLDEDGLALYLGNFTGAYKPVLTEGAGGDMEFVLTLDTDGLAPVVIEMNPTVVIANRQWVIDGFVRISTFDAHVAQNTLEHNNLLLLIQQLTQMLANTQEELMDTQVIQGIQQTLILMQERLTSLEQNAIQLYKPGDVYMTTIDHGNAAAVATFLGYGTWQVYSPGRAVVGAGSYTDSNGISRTIAGGQVFGQYQQTLTTENLEPHAHIQMASSDQTVGQPNQTAPVSKLGSSGSNNTVGVTTDDFFANTLAPLETGETGGNQDGEAEPFDLSPPSTGTYLWVRLT